MNLTELYNDISLNHEARLYDNAIALSVCPICGHVTTKLSKKATAIVQSEHGLAYKCFYCDNGGKKGAIFHVLKEFGLYEKYAPLITTSTIINKEQKNYYLSEITPLDDNTMSKIHPIKEGSLAYEYLKSRKLESFSHLFREFEKNSGDSYLLYPSIYNDFIFGGRYRILPQSEEKRVFSLANLSSANKYHMIFKCSKINSNKPIYVFEGVEDALSSGKANSIAIFGTNIKVALNWYFNSQLVFCLDNDEAGLSRMRSIAKEYPNRFLFLRYDESFGEYKDFNDRLKAGFSLDDNSFYISSHLVRYL